MQVILVYSSRCRNRGHYADRAGYGRLKWQLRPQQAHRLAWESARGAIPDGLNVLHHCDTPACINTDHLFLGTHADNSADRVAKGRQARGERVGGAKLTTAQVLEIRGMAGSQREIAERFDVAPSLICEIKRRGIWKHLQDLTVTR